MSGAGVALVGLWGLWNRPWEIQARPGVALVGPWGLWNRPWEIQAGPGQPDLGEDTWRPCTCPPFTLSANLLSGPHLQTRKQIQEGSPSCLRVSRAEAGEGQALRQWALEPFPGPGPGMSEALERDWRGPQADVEARLDTRVWG